MKPTSSKTYSWQEVIEHWYKMAHGGYQDEKYWKGHADDLKDWLENEKRLLKGHDKWKLVDLPVAETVGHYECNEDVIKDYMAEHDDHNPFPPIIVVRKGDKWETLDGCHRLGAAKKLGHRTIQAFIPEESLREKAVAKYRVIAKDKIKYNAWVRPTRDTFLKRDYHEIYDNEAYLDKGRYPDEELIDPNDRHVPFEIFKKVVSKGPIRTLSKEEAKRIVEEAVGKVPPVEWLIHPEKGPNTNWHEDNSHRYSKDNVNILVPKFLNNEPIDMPIMLYDDGKPVFASGGRHRMAYALALGVDIKVVEISEEQLVLESGLLTPETIKRFSK